MATLEARALTKRYASIPAVDNVSFTIASGEVLGYIGHNGAGKSTTVKILTGLLEPSSGHVLLDGRDIREDLEDYKRQVGYVPELSDLYTFLTGWEYLEMVATLRKLDRKRFAAKASAMLQELSIYPARHSLIGSYSKGMRQRIVMIAALMHDPQVLILDELFSGLDVTSVLVIRKVVELLAASGKAVFFSSPVLEVVEKLCTHVIVLKNGRAIASGTMEEIRKKGRDLEAAFFEITEHADTERIARNVVAAVRA